MVGENAKQKPKFNFEMLDVPVGSILTFKDQEDVICKVTNQKPPRVCYKGEVVSLTKAAEMARGKNDSVNGSKFWTYEGELLWDRRERLEELTDEAFAVIATGPESPDAKKEKQPSSKNTEARYNVIEASNRNRAQAEISRLESRVKQLETEHEKLLLALTVIFKDVSSIWQSFGTLQRQKDLEED